ncbi:DUF4450 domain-containing protein [Sphingobacterium suaedae]|uniref:DUF4450 domain-containing protein n=1 Tax=Sphingobacterium suaedae TaxID=1686402 RepID=A0ABW5KJQ1_9SPHI
MWRILISSFFLLEVLGVSLYAQSKHWQKNDRTLHYTEDQGDFLLLNGTYRFNRALYGDNRASRVEAGDLPEFALYLPGMGGNLQFVLRQGATYKKLIDAKHIETRYRPGSMCYTIHDPLLGGGKLRITVMAQAHAEGLVLKLEGENVAASSILYAVYGGASGKTFSRNGDIGADPESGFYLLPAYTENNHFTVTGNRFTLRYLGKRREEQFIHGTFSGTTAVHVGDALALEALSTLEGSTNKDHPIVYAKYDKWTAPVYMQIAKGEGRASHDNHPEMVQRFEQAEEARRQLVDRLRLRTPDRFINTFGAALAIAADGIWESPTYLHGAVAWRMRLNAWRGAYAADALGWHDRAKEHFSSYVNAQVLEPKEGPVVMDTALHLARHVEQMGTSVFTSGYISRNPNNNTVPHHYDMNLVFFDQLFSHFDYTGDKVYLRKMWPAIVRHLTWEKRNFDRDGDGLYDAYCAIWASDGLQYAGGGVTHTTMYNYRANRSAAKLATILGEDPTPYLREAALIEKALKERLWLADRGYFAEFQDALGNRLRHDMPGLWTIYHTADAFLLDDFESYQNLQYIQHYLPKIPVNVKGMEHTGLYTLSTTNWQPYTWSVNNVALAENLQTALAYWQAGRNEDAFLLWKSNVIESMYHGISPGNFQQLSHYDAFRGELYRDFADPIGVASRTLVEGLFGVYPKLMEKKVVIKPGFPSGWDFAEIDLPAWSYAYKRMENRVQFDIRTRFDQPVKLQLEIPVHYAQVKAVRVNNQAVSWTLKPSAIDRPILLVETPESTVFTIEVVGAGVLQQSNQQTIVHPYTDAYALPVETGIQIGEVRDPQGLLTNHQGNEFRFVERKRKGTFFVQLKRADMQWWQPVNMELVEPVAVRFAMNDKGHHVDLKNRTGRHQRISVTHDDFQKTAMLNPGEEITLILPSDMLSKGTNRFALNVEDAKWNVDYTTWEVGNKGGYETNDLSTFYNARLTQIFQQQYLSPRPEGPTLQLPWQGIGNWCYPLTTAHIDDQGLMSRRSADVVTFLDIPFLIKGEEKNVLFTSQWDNYPTSVDIPVRGKARKLYLLMAGSTNPMQSQLVNAKIRVTYMDGQTDTLDLRNPTNWWPIEQDYLDDNYAFEIPDESIPYRVELKTGNVYRGGELKAYEDIKGYTTRAVDGGAATLLDLPLDPEKEIKALRLQTHANDVVVGLIAATLLRPI